MDIYNVSHQNYGAPKITAELRKNGETIAERTVGKYMKEIGIKAQWVKPYTKTTVDPDFSSTLKNILNEQLTRKSLTPFGAATLHIFGRSRALSISQALWTFIQEKLLSGRCPRPLRLSMWLKPCAEL